MPVRLMGQSYCWNLVKWLKAGKKSRSYICSGYKSGHQVNSENQRHSCCLRCCSAGQGLPERSCGPHTSCTQLTSSQWRVICTDIKTPTISIQIFYKNYCVTPHWCKGNGQVSWPGTQERHIAVRAKPLDSLNTRAAQEPPKPGKRDPPPGRSYWMLPGQHRQSKLQRPTMSSFYTACLYFPVLQFHSPQGCDSMSFSCVRAAASWFSPISRHMLKQSAIMLCFSLSPGRQRLM